LNDGSDRKQLKQIRRIPAYERHGLIWRAPEEGWHATPNRKHDKAAIPRRATDAARAAFAKRSANQRREMHF
jgi:hypothetical protein